jgi:hypothetical protein
MYVQAKKDPTQEWVPTWYRLTEEEMGQIMKYWDDDWKISPTKDRAIKTRDATTRY